MTNKEQIIRTFRKVKKLGWVESHRRSNTGIGKTFEDYMGVVENNLDEPDLFGLLNSTHKCNLSVRPFVMVAKLAKKYSRGVRKPSFFLGLLFNLF